ncbi:hypothetical protein [Pseudomonas japonica]|uniref:Lipoprotein n=1 Tax=Pseudomonas japonica TaxID=256466 RepID=A0A239CIN2_9PSED|nr:hypothetical protein [Pseudomonas japonica]SNS20045.1 hypothetical protein SAMN05444352_104234 [Pseudomonas japonica]
MSSMIRMALLGLALAFAAGCTSKPVMAPKELLVVGHSYSNDDIQRAILQAVAERGWTARNVVPGLVQADITVRNTFYAAVDIRYSLSNFRIDYRDSRGLDYNNGKIHRNYNRWVYNLDKSIMRELQRIETNRMVQRAVNEQRSNNH